MNKPIELQNAIQATETCWDRYDAAIESGDKVSASALWHAMAILEDNQSSQYKQWQILGGTSNIESIALAEMEDQPTPAEVKAKADAECETYETRYMNKTIHMTDEGCGNDDLYDWSRGG